jgi:transcriptional regulator with XRE-family HTH domain
MKTTEDLLALIEERRTELGLTQVEVGRRAFGKADNSVISNMKRGSAPTYDRLVALCDALGLVLYIGRPGTKYSPMSKQLADDDFLGLHPTGEGFLPVQWLEPKPDSGSAPVAFLDSWLSANGLILDNLAAVSTANINVPGYHSSKAIAVIDTTAPRRGFGLWLLKEPAGDSVASVSFEGSDLIVVNEKRESAPRLIRDWSESMVRLQGKVVWLGLMPDR